jgi:hypothetical protein
MPPVWWLAGAGQCYGLDSPASRRRIATISTIGAPDADGFALREAITHLTAEPAHGPSRAPIYITTHRSWHLHAGVVPKRNRLMVMSFDRGGESSFSRAHRQFSAGDSPRWNKEL